MPLTEAQCNLLDNNWGVLCREIDLNAVVDYLEECRIVTPGQAHLLKMSPDGCAELLSLLKHHSSSAFDALHGALRHCGQDSLCDVLFAELSPALSCCSAPDPELPEEEEFDLAPLLERSLSLPDDQIGPRVMGGVLDWHVKRCESPTHKKHSYHNYTRPKGLALIFNNTFHTEEDEDDRRDGSTVDAVNIAQVLGKLKYSVETKTDLTAAEMRAAIKSFAKRPEHNKCDSAIVVVLSHGDKNRIVGSDWRTVMVDKFTNKLNAKYCPALCGKPKIFFNQACRGKKRDIGVHCAGFGDPSSDFSDDELLEESQICSLSPLASRPSKIPTPSDMLIACSSADDHISHRHPIHGSWFIRELCKTLAAQSWDTHLLDMLTTVNDRVSEKVSHKGERQIPQFTSTLRKRLYFYPGLHLHESSDQPKPAC